MGVESALMMQATGAGLSTIGSYFNAQGQRTALKSQAAIDDVNARLAETSAQQTLLKGQTEEQATRLRTGSIKGTQRASMAANGIDLGSDSAVNVLTTTDVMGENDAATVASNALRAAFGYRTQAVSYKNDALTKRAAADSITPWMAAGTTLLTGASSVADKYYTYKKFGLLDTSTPYQNDPTLPWRSGV